MRPTAARCLPCLRLLPRRGCGWGRREPIGAIILIGLGVLFLLNTLDIFNFDWFGHLWPLLIIGFGVALFLRRAREVPPSPPPPPPPVQRKPVNRYIFLHRIKGPVIILVFGVTALLHTWHILSYSRSWPLYLIAIGLLQLAERAAWAQMQAPPHGISAGTALRPARKLGRPQPGRPHTALIITPRNMNLKTEEESKHEYASEPSESGPISASEFSSRKPAGMHAPSAIRPARNAITGRPTGAAEDGPPSSGPIILLAIGIIALLVELGRLNGYAIWNWYVQWWPLLLIALGLISLVEYFFDRRDPYARGAPAADSFSSSSSCCSWAGARTPRATGATTWAWTTTTSGSCGARSTTTTCRWTRPLAANGTVNVQNPRGDVTITPSTDGQIHLRAHEIVHTASDDDAQKAFDAIHPQIEASGTNITVSVPSHRGSAVNLALQVPEESQVMVNAGHGDVAIEGLKKNADVTAPHGDVKFDSIGGDVHARMRDGDFSAHAIGGQVFLNGHAGDVTLSEIKGQTTLDGEFFGDTHLEQMDGPIHFHSSRTTIDLPRLGGDLTLNSDDLQATQTGGPLRIVTRSKNIDLTQAAGDIHIESSNGDINIAAAAPLGNIDITNRTGDLTLTVPENAEFLRHRQHHRRQRPANRFSPSGHDQRQPEAAFRNHR